MDVNDKNFELLKIIQTDFPLVGKPFYEISTKISMNPDEIIDTVITLMENRVIRNIGPVFESSMLGYVSTLAAVSVESHKVPELAAAMIDINEITHNYMRNHQINLWFTITARNRERIDEILYNIKRFPGVYFTIELPMVTAYKIRAVFGESAESENHISNPVIKKVNPDTNIPVITENEMRLIRFMHKGIPVLEKPFGQIARIIDSDEETVIGTLQKWKENGTIRRFGARLDHRKSGYNVNVLTAWKGDTIDSAGKAFADFPEITHCYRRKTAQDWPYELYAMVHAKSEEEMENIIQRMKLAAYDLTCLPLKSLYEFKKTTMKYFSE